jgi:hypothetical protein
MLLPLYKRRGTRKKRRLKKRKDRTERSNTTIFVAERPTRKGQNYYKFTTGAAGTYTIALTGVASWLSMDLYSREYFSGPVASAPEGRGQMMLSVDLSPSTTFLLAVNETALLSASDTLITTDRFQLLVTGP